MDLVSDHTNKEREAKSQENLGHITIDGVTKNDLDFIKLESHYNVN
jgi:hypothetical protein